jgi:hypothetical protein
LSCLADRSAFHKDEETWEKSDESSLAKPVPVANLSISASLGLAGFLIDVNVPAPIENNTGRYEETACSGRPKLRRSGKRMPQGQDAFK